MFKKIFKSFEESFKEDSNSNTVKLAKQYNVPFCNGEAEASCPGILNPLGETPKIQLQWESGLHNDDKTERFNQFTKALELIDTHCNGKNIKEKYLELDIHGRVMVTYIACKNDIDIFKVILPYAKEELNMKQMPYGKGNVSVERIFDFYVQPKIELYSKLTKKQQEVKQEEIKQVEIEVKEKPVKTKEGLKKAVFNYLSDHQENAVTITKILFQEHDQLADLSQSLFKLKDTELSGVVTKYFIEFEFDS